MKEVLEEQLDRIRREHPSLHERLDDYRRQKKEYDDSVGRTHEGEKEPAAWRKHEPQRRYGI